MLANSPTLLKYLCQNFDLLTFGMIEAIDREILKRFGERVHSLRKAKNLSFRKMSMACKIDFADIKRIELGEVNVTLLTLLELSKGLGVDAKELLDFTIEPLHD